MLPLGSLTERALASVFVRTSEAGMKAIDSTELDDGDTKAEIQAVSWY